MIVLALLATHVGISVVFPSAALANTTQQTAYAIVGTVNVPSPEGIAVSSDDTVYVVNSAQNTLSVTNPARGSRSLCGPRTKPSHRIASPSPKAARTRRQPGRVVRIECRTRL